MSSGEPTSAHPCVNYVSRSLQDGGQSLTDVAHPDEL